MASITNYSSYFPFRTLLHAALRSLWICDSSSRLRKYHISFLWHVYLFHIVFLMAFISLSQYLFLMAFISLSQSLFLVVFISLSQYLSYGIHISFTMLVTHFCCRGTVTVRCIVTCGHDLTDVHTRTATHTRRCSGS